jgi:serine phosphatase RsbU (regulator of sigma subunit)/Tfp pilus assembly protein PilF
MKKAQRISRCLKSSLFFIALWVTSLSAQSPHLDSLFNLLAVQPDDTNKVNALNEIARAYLREFNDIMKVGEYGKKELHLARKLNYKKGIAQAMINVAIMYRSGTSNYDLALYYDRMALKLMREIGNKKGEAIALGNIGLTFSEKGDYKQALEFLRQGLKMQELIGDKRGVAIANINIANIYHTQGNYTEAMSAHLISLKMNEELGNKNGIGSCYNNIGTLLYSQQKIDESLGYYLKAVKIWEGTHNFQGLGQAYGNIGNIYRDKKQFKEALTYMLKEFKISEQQGDKQGIAVAYNNIAAVYADENKPDIALTYQLNSYAIAKEIGDKRELGRACGAIANSYEAKKDYTNAIHYNLEMLSMSKKIDFREGSKIAYGNLASVYRKQKQFEKALEYTELYNTMKDSLLNKENFKQVAELNTRYETEKKEKEILLLTKDQQLNAKIIRQQQLVRWGLIGGLGLLCISIFSIYRRYRFKQKANLILEQQKKEIQQKNVLITDSIDYAKTIQDAVLPTTQQMKNLLPESFVLYKPKAIVSGDFYWLGNVNGRLICAVADCTGHGVPGAFMSLLGYNMLEDVAQSNFTATPGKLLDALNQQVIQRLSGDDKEEIVKHGMDISLISIDQKTNRLEFAGAHNSLYIVRRGELMELKADKMGIGANKQADTFYSNQVMELQTGDMIYLFTDGFPDQIGGPNRKKFFYPPFKELLKTISPFPVELQQAKLNETHIQWLGTKMDQTDDILIMGIRYSSNQSTVLVSSCR